MKSLALNFKYPVDDNAGLAELARLESLEEITSDSRMATVEGLESLLALKRLRVVHIAGLDLNLAASTEEAVVLRHTLERLRQSHLGIVVDADYSAGFQDEGNFVPWSGWGSFLGLVIPGP